MKFRFHVISLPHTQTTKDYVACAYTQKVIKFCTMMKSLGHEVYLYASEENEAPCDELITIVTKKQQKQWFGDYDFKKSFFNIDWDPSKPHWLITGAKAAREIKKRAKAKDFICIIGGVCQKPISDSLPKLMSVEYGIGYYGVYAPFRVYESYAQMNYVQGQNNDDNTRFFDAVIPNYFDPADFPFKQKKDDFYLYIGRMISRKGPEIAAEATRRAGAKLVLVGQGVEKIEGNKIISKELTLEGDHLLHLGHADVKMRGELMSRAKAVFTCSTYIEPFGGTSIEPLFCGTPVIATDTGAFSENILSGEVGYRIRTLGEATWAAQNLDKLKSARALRKYAIDNFSLIRVRDLYQAYFEQLYTLHEADKSNNGWYSDWHAGLSKYHRYSRKTP